ncbi:nonribosomal peptide synthase GliP2 [Phyllosticta citriasiana]|uniref:nonribosomal peptide synthase GliP2 n=1 Tax=Phyllosticta citriasiana TaxID=595635 RepID=UPI0030FD4462
MGSIVDLFAKCAAHHASRPALEDWTKGPSSLRQYTYREIDIASSNFCQRLRRHGLRKGDRIPLLAARSPAMVVAVLAILKLGACYVPVDLSSWGPERIETTLEIVGAKTLVCTEELGAPLAGYEMIRFTNEDMVFDEHDVDIVVEDAPSPDDLAYIIFTSGSTGKPKGVVVAHRSMANYARSNGQESSFNVKVTARSRILMLFSIAFDGCAGVLFSTLCNGGCLVIASPATFAKAAQTCTELPLTPSILMALDPNSGYDSVESVLLGGEKPSEALVNAWASPTRKVWNAYGPTEATCVTLMAELQPESPIVLGYPVNNTSVVLLDESGNEADEGEICIGGLGLAVGYFNDPERTEKAFVTHKGQRIYKSGDFGKMTPAGITFAGRKDSLVKNRGFLVNLETEVEPALLSVGSVTAAAALMERGRLHAFVTPSGADDGLRERLLQEYSSFLVPDNIVALDQLPMTSNGKIDLKALRSLVVDDSEDMVRSGEDLSPVQAVMEVFRTTLGVRLTDISSDTSFRDLGGHSLAAVRITTTLRKYSYSITVPQIFSLDTVEAISDALTKLTVEATANLSQSIEDEQALWKPVEHHFGKKPASVFKVAPMTEMQLRMVHGTIESPTVNYIRVSATFDLRNGLDVASKLKEAWYAAISQHEICRTTFLLSEGAGVQLIHDEASVDWTEHFIQDDDDFEEACRKLDNWEDSDPVALQLPHIHSLSSVQLLTVPNNRTRLTWTVHHSLTDGWSIASFVNDFAFAAGGAAIPPRPSFPTVSTAIKSLQASQANEARNYWASKIGQLDVVPRLTLPQSSTPTSSRQSEKSIALRITSADLEQVAQVAKVTPAAIFYGAWAVILSKYCATKDVIMGAVLAGRNIPVEGIAEVCGPLLSTLPLRVHLGSAESSFELLQDVFASLCEMSNYQTSSNALIQSATGTKATDLFETLLALQYDFPEATWPSTDVPAPYDVRATETSELPLSVLIESSDGALEARFIYRHDRFEAATVERMSQHFENALFSMVEGTWNRAMGEISNAMMSPVEQRLLVDGFEGLREPYVGPRTLKAAFGEAAKRFATLPALEAGKFSITYEELDRRSDVVASKLLSTESQSKFIAVLADGSIGWIVAILAVLKTGAAYLPLDHKIAHERQRLMLELAETDLVLYPSEASVTHRVEGVTALAVDTMLEEAFDVDVGMILQDDVPADDDVVCLIFTSGSTGIPKGVQLQNSGILSCLANPIARAHTVPGQRNAQVVAYGFDICVMEIFSTLLYGGVFVLKDENDPLGHLRSVDAAFITPSMLGTLDHNAYSNLQIITLVGEGAPQTIVDKWGRDRYIINAYGPAEATLSVNYSYCHAGKPINAGRPLPRMASYVLDEDNQPVPVGCTGEILLSGVQVTPGYLKLPEKTQQVFSPDPFHPDLAMTMYRTGDIGRWTPDMELQVIGRTDNQVKVRGSRVDILDVEAMIRRAYPTVESVAVVLSSNSLIAHVTPIDVDVRALKTAVQANLPYYCQPNRFVLMSQLPLNQNHKVNRKALEALEVDVGSADSTPLETDTERLVAKVWRETLATSGGEQRVHNIGALDSFFDLGGHSLLQIKVAQQLSQALDRSVSLKTVIRHLVLRDLAAALDDNALSDSDTSGASAVSFLNAPLVEPRHVMPLSSLEAEFFETYMAAPGSGAFSMPFAFRVHGLFDHARFAQAFTDVMSKHPVLRSRYCLVDDKPARVLSDIIREPEILTCTTGAVDTLIQAEINAPFDLATDQPIRVKLFVENDTSTVVSITMSHIVGDATSLAVLLDQLTKSYASPSLSSVPPQAVPADRYATWTNWFSTQPPAPASTTSFWQQHLATATPNLLTSFTQRQPSHRGSYLHVPVPPRLRLALKRRAARSRVPPHTIALAAVGLTLATMTNLPAGHDIVLGAPYANRAEEGTGDVVGLLLDRVAIKIPFSSTTDAGEEGKKDKANIASLLAAIASSSQASLAHYMPLANVARAVSASPSHSPSQHTFSPLFDSMVTYHTAHETSTRVPHFSLPSSQPVDSDIQADVVTNGATQTQTVLLHAHARGAKYPLMFEFTESPCGGRLALDLEYDEAMFDGIVVDEIAKLVVAALELVVGEKETTVGEAKKRLGELWGLTGGREKVGDSGAVVDMEMEEALPVVVAVEA